jgi:hypothetical protein
MRNLQKENMQVILEFDLKAGFPLSAKLQEYKDKQDGKKKESRLPAATRVHVAKR